MAFYNEQQEQSGAWTNALKKGVDTLFGADYSLIGKPLSDAVMRVMRGRKTDLDEEMMSKGPRDLMHLMTGYPEEDWAMGALHLGMTATPLMAPILRPSAVNMAKKKGLLSPKSMRVADQLEKLTEIDKTMLKSFARKPSNAVRIDGFLKANPQVMEQVAGIEQETGTPLTGLDGGITKSPIELRMKPDDPSRPMFGGFTRSLAQTYLDNMDETTREEFRQEMVQAMEDEYANNRRGGMFNLAIKNIAWQQAGKSNPYVEGKATEDYYTLGSPVSPNKKTMVAADLSTSCPMFNCGNHGCYLDACYVTGAAKGGSSFPLYRSAMYTGEILQLDRPTINSLNKAGGLRMNGMGDTSYDQVDQWADIFRHADQQGLKLKVITKQDDTFRILQELRNRGIKNADEIIVQPTVDPYWVPVQLDKQMTLGKPALDTIQQVEAGGSEPQRMQALASTYKTIFGRDAKVIQTDQGPVLMRKYGYSWDQIREMGRAQKDPNHPQHELYKGVKIQPRIVVATPKEIAEYALNVPEGLQTLMHAKVKEPLWSEIEGDWVSKHAKNYRGAGVGRHGAKKVKGKWQFGGQAQKGARLLKQTNPYRETQEYWENNYTPDQVDTIMQRLAGSGRTGKGSIMCCGYGTSDAACADCNSHGAQRTYYQNEDLENIGERGAGAGSGPDISNVEPAPAAEQQVGPQAGINALRP